MTKLHVFSGLALPKDAVTQTFGVLAIKGVGKTYLEMKLFEELVKLGLQAIAIDSMGVFWGLRAAANGVGPGLRVTIFGGERADVPLVPTAGRVIAELLARENIPAILDISDFRKNEQRRFVADFASEFYHQKKKHRDPVHLVLDEADLWAPQRVDKGWEVLLGAVEDLVRRGRARGIGVTMATQRPAVINKDVLSQISVLVAMQMSSPYDIAAVDTWVRSNGTQKQRDALVGELASLQKGEAWVWSPAWLRLFKRTHVLARETFDSSKTPEVGEKIREPKALARVDIAKIKAAVEATAELQKSDDPRLLRAKIGELQRNIILLKSQVEKKPVTVPAATVTVTKAVEVPVIKPRELIRLEKVLRELSTAAGRIEGSAGDIRAHADTMRDRIEAIDRKQKQVQSSSAWAQKVGLVDMKTKAAAAKTETVSVPIVNAEAMKKAGYKTPPTARQLHDLPKLRKGELEILKSCVRIGDGATESQLGVLAGFPAGGSTFKTYVSVLKRKGLIVGNGNGMGPTELGKAVVGHVEPMPTDTSGLAELWKRRLRAGEGRILDWIIEKGAGGATLDEASAEFQDFSASTLLTYISVLKRCGLVAQDGGKILMSEALGGCGALA